MPDERQPASPYLGLLQTILRDSPAATVVLGGPRLRILLANPAFCAAAGQEERAMLGRPAAEALPRLARAGHLRRLERIRAAGQPWHRAAVPLRLRPGAPARIWAVETTPLRIVAGAAPDLLIQLRDVTEERRALREGEAARATLDALFAHIPEGLILAEGPEMRIRRVSAYGLALSGRGTAEEEAPGCAAPPGHSPAEAWETLHGEILHADGTTPARREELPLTRAARCGETVQHETWMLRREDGTLVPILCSAGPIRDEQGRITGGIVAWRDVTELRRAEAALAASEARYRALVEAGAQAVWIRGGDGSQRSFRGWTALTGQTQEEAAGRGWLNAIHPDDREQARRRWAEALATGNVYETEYRVAQAGGGWRWTATRAVPVREEASGRIVEWVGVNTDIHARKLAESALRASQERFRTLAETMPHLVWQTDHRGEPEYMNRRMQAFTGLTPATARGGRWLGLLHPEDAARLAEAWGQALAAGTECDVDARLAAPEGGWRWFRIQSAPVRDAGGRIRQWVGTCTDVEDRHRAEAALREAVETQARLLRTAEHRIRNSLQLVASLLRLKAGRAETPAARGALEGAVAWVRAVAEAHRALGRSPDMHAVRVADMLQELAAGASALRAGADLRAEAPPGLLLDAERAIPVALVLNELLTRALARRAREKEWPGPVLLSARATGTGLALEVAGLGTSAFPPETAEGMGETVVRALLRQIGATLETETTPDGTGCRAVLRLPLADAGAGGGGD